MADVNPPVVGNAAAFERSARAILARAEQALKQSVATLTEVKGLAGQIEAAAAASQGETQATEAINRKANAAERAAAAVALQNQHMREASAAAQGETAAAVAIERKAVAAERAAAAMAEMQAAGMRPAQARINAEQRLLELQARNAEIERSAAARQAIVTGGQAGRLGGRLDYQEQVPLRRQQGAERAREAAEQSRLERQLATNSAASARGYQAVSVGAGEANLAVRSSAVAMALSEERSASLGSTLLRTAGEYGKFAVATGGLFAVVDLFKNIYDGATEAQQGVQALRRVMTPEAISRDGGAGAAMAGFGELSREVNVPIKDAAEATQLMARQFQNLPDALTAARVALGFTKLDAISTADSVRFLGAAAQAFRIDPKDLEARVADPIENVARRGGEPPAQILRAFAASAQIANAGGSPEQLAGLVGAAIRGSAQTGNVIATAFQRSIANAVPREEAQATIKRLGLDPREATTNYTEFLKHAIERSRELSGNERRELALAIGGKFYGSRVFQPLFERPEQSLDRLRMATTDPGRQGAFAQELHEQLKRIDEQVTAIGNAFQRVGEQLTRAHLLDGLSAVLRLLRYTVDEAERFVSLFNAVVPDPFAPWLASLGAIALIWRGMRRFDVPGRLAQQTTETGLVGRHIPATTRNRIIAQAAADAERTAVADSLARARSNQLSSAVRYRTTQQALAGGLVVGPFGSEAAHRSAMARNASLAEANNKAREAFIAADRETTALLEVESGLAKRQAATAESIALARSQSAAANTVILPPGVVRPGTAAPVDARVAQRDALEAMGMGAMGAGLMSRMGARAAERDALESMGFGRMGSGLMASMGEGGMIAGLAGGLGKLVGGIAPFLGILAGFNAVSAIASTHGNVSERAHKGLQALTFGIWDSPVTGAENRKAGREDAEKFIEHLHGGLAPGVNNVRLMNERRKAITDKINELDASSGGDPRRIETEMNRLEGRLARETHLEQAAAAIAKARKGKGRGSLVDDLMGLNAKELNQVLTENLLPMTTVGDDRGLSTAVAVADTYSKLGHQKGRTDLLQKAQQAIQQTVGAITSELTDNLALANSQGDRDKAYAEALAQADRLLASHSPAQRHAGELLKRDTQLKQLQDDAQGRATETGIGAATHPGDIVGNAQRAAADARRNYRDTREALGADAPETRAAFQKYQEARNQANDARIQRIQRDGGLEEAQQRTAIGKDNVRVQTLQRALAAARAAPHPNTNTIVQLEGQLADAKAQQTQQLVNDANAATDAYYAYLEAQTDDPLQQALLEQRRVANQKLDPTDPNAPAKQRALNAQQAQRTRQAAHQDAMDRLNARYDRLDALADPGDTAGAADRAYRRAVDARRNTPGLTDAERRRQDNDVRRTRGERLRAHQQSAYDDITHNANIGKLTNDMEVNALRRLKDTIHGNRALKRQIEEQIYSLTHQNEGSLELQLGNIRLPTGYEVNRAIREAGGGRRASTRGMAVHNSVNVTVTGDTDIGKMANAIDGVLGTSTRSALRASGVL